MKAHDRPKTRFLKYHGPLFLVNECAASILAMPVRLTSLGSCGAGNSSIVDMSHAPQNGVHHFAAALHESHIAGQHSHQMTLSAIKLLIKGCMAFLIMDAYLYMLQLL
jgi:hypothetical protein